LLLNRLVLIGNAGEQPHPFDEADAVGMFPCRLPPVCEGLLQALRVDLNPLAAQQDEALRAGQELLAFLIGKRLAVQGQAHLKIKQFVQSDGASGPRADLHAHLRARRPTCRQPIGRAHDHSGFFDLRSLGQKAIGLANGPGLGRKQCFVVKQLAYQATLFAGPLHRLEQRFQLAAILGSGVELERFGQRQVLRPRLGRKPVRVGGQEREGPGRAIPARAGEAHRESGIPVRAWAELRPPTRRVPCQAAQESMAIGRSLFSEPANSLKEPPRHLAPEHKYGW
jgi:hypothetical protein